ncbi:MAG: hypothetical protein J6K25_05840 [Thermoguttaceae bacterium]|nr:hypothetical protein [Thermoguttaceae bacterium]
MGGITTAFVEKEILKKLRICPLALFASWGIFLPVAGNDRDDDKRRFAFERKSQKRKRK